MCVDSFFLSYKFINSLGLCFDIISVSLIWHYGIPDKVPKETVWGDRYKRGALERYTRRSALGLRLLIYGFSLQVFSNFLPI